VLNSVADSGDRNLAANWVPNRTGRGNAHRRVPRHRRAYYASIPTIHRYNIIYIIYTIPQHTSVAAAYPSYTTIHVNNNNNNNRNVYNARFAAKVIKRIHGYNVGIE